MKTEKSKTNLGTFLLGFLCAAALVLIVRLDSPRVAMADSASSGATGELIAVTGSDNTGLGMLYIINAKSKKIAVYQWDRTYLYLFAIRDINTDFSPEIDNFNNEARRKITPADLKVEIEKKLKAREKKK